MECIRYCIDRQSETSRSLAFALEIASFKLESVEDYLGSVSKE